MFVVWSENLVCGCVGNMTKFEIKKIQAEGVLTGDTLLNFVYLWNSIYLNFIWLISETFSIWIGYIC